MREGHVVRGIPTKPDVEELLRVIHHLKPGDRIEYEMIEKIIKKNRGTHRYGSVVSAWRRRLWIEQNIVLLAIPNEGFVVANNSERVHHAHDKKKQGLKRVFRASDIAVRTENDGLSDDERKSRDHLIKTVASLKLAVDTAAKQLQYEFNRHR